MPSKSKTKGSSFEREVAKFLSGLYGEPFVRVPNSGAYTGGLNSHRKSFLDGNQAKSFKGDIIAPDAWKNFNSECKSYADLPFHLILTGESNLLDSWLEQLMTAGDDNDLNILFIKISRKGKFVAVQSSLTWSSDNFVYYSSKSHGDWIIIEFNHFFNLNRDLLKSYSLGISTDTMSINNTQESSTDTMSNNSKTTSIKFGT
jgi:hypothetical protein